MTVPGLRCRCPGRQRSAVRHVSDSTHTLSKSARLGPVEFGKVRDLGRLSCVMCAERFWT